MKERTDCRACGGQQTAMPIILQYADHLAGESRALVKQAKIEHRWPAFIYTTRELPAFQLYICEACGTVRGEKR